MLTMFRRKPFKERKQTRNTDYGAHDVVHIGGVNNHVGPVVTIFCKKEKLTLVGELKEMTNLAAQPAPSNANPKTRQRTFRP